MSLTMKLSYKSSGNRALYILYNIFNFLFLLQSLLVIGAGTWLWNEAQQIGTISLSFICIGSIQFLLSLTGQHMKQSVPRLNLYIFLHFIFFILQTTLIILTISSHQKFIDWAENLMQKTQEQDIIKAFLSDHMYIAIGVTAGIVSIQLFCIVLAFLYRRSYLRRNDDQECLIEDRNGRAVSLQQHQEQQRRRAQEKHDQQKRALYNKYPQLQQKQQNQQFQQQNENNQDF